MTAEDDIMLMDKVVSIKNRLIEASKHFHDGDLADKGDCPCLDCIVDDAMDQMIMVRYECGKVKYDHCELTFAWGGPNIYYNSKSGQLEGFWGNSHYVANVGDDVADRIDNWMESKFSDATKVAGCNS